MRQGSLHQDLMAVHTQTLRILAEPLNIRKRRHGPSWHPVVAPGRSTPAVTGRLPSGRIHVPVNSLLQREGWALQSPTWEGIYHEASPVLVPKEMGSHLTPNQGRPLVPQRAACT